MFKAENRACERRQRGFDRSEYRKLLRLSLLRGYKTRQAQGARRPRAPRPLAPFRRRSGQAARPPRYKIHRPAARPPRSPACRLRTGPILDATPKRCHSDCHARTCRAPRRYSIAEFIDSADRPPARLDPMRPKRVRTRARAAPQQQRSPLIGWHMGSRDDGSVRVRDIRPGRLGPPLPASADVARSGKTLFITGAAAASACIGAAGAARDGANIAVVAKTDEPHPEAAREPSTPPRTRSRPRAAAPAAHRRRPRRRRRSHAAVARTMEKFGGIDILVNNASAIRPRRRSSTPT